MLYLGVRRYAISQFPYPYRRIPEFVGSVFILQTQGSCQDCQATGGSKVQLNRVASRNSCRCSVCGFLVHLRTCSHLAICRLRQCGGRRNPRFECRGSCDEEPLIVVALRGPFRLHYSGWKSTLIEFCHCLEAIIRWRSPREPLRRGSRQDGLGSLRASQISHSFDCMRKNEGWHQHNSFGAAEW